MNTHKFSPLASKMLCISQVTALDSATEKQQAKLFRKSIEKALLLLEGNKWLQDTEGKQYLTDCKLTIEDAVKQAYGLNKAQYYLNIRVAKATLRLTNVVDNFLSLCDAKQGAVSYSIQNFDNYVKKLDKAVDNPLGLNEEGVEGEEGASTEGSVVDVDTKAKPIVTFTFNGEAMKMNNVSLRITEKGELKTSSSAEDVAKAIAYLQGTLLQLKAETTAKVEASKPKVEASKPKVVTAKPKVEEKPKVSKFKIKPTVSVDPAVAAFEAEIASGAPVDADELMDAPF